MNFFGLLSSAQRDQHHARSSNTWKLLYILDKLQIWSWKGVPPMSLWREVQRVVYCFMVEERLGKG